ncbi:MAG: hypothetical protein SFX18_11835 [Pirellulales bacterium]|nr:hypothetical protein [Pirellulales bacterium]
MSQSAVEFMQLSELRLDQPCGGLVEVPDLLRETLLDAPYRAASRAFDLALEQEVDFVLLSGHTADLQRAGPRAAIFLEQQFTRLAEKQIPVYWAAGPKDPAWEETLDGQWPRNVRIFPRNHAEIFNFERYGVPLIRLVGRSGEASAWHLNDHVITESPLFTIGLGLVPPAQPDGKRWDVDYWCLHGQASATPAERQHLPQVEHVWFHAAGSPQGRSFAELHTHGCTLVSVGEDRKVKMRTCATDAVRYFDEVVTCGPRMDHKACEAAVLRRGAALREQHPTVTSIVRWTITGEAEQLPPAWPDEWSVELLAQLRRDLAGGSHPLWSSGLRVFSAEIPAELLAQRTLLGDYLRSLGEYEQMVRDQRSAADWPGLGTAVAAPVAEYLNWHDPAVRRQSLAEAAWWGIRLLGTEEVAG